MSRVTAVLQVLRGHGWGWLLTFALGAAMAGTFVVVILVGIADWLRAGDWRPMSASVVKIEENLMGGGPKFRFRYDRIHYRYRYAGQDYGNSYSRESADVKVDDEISVIVNPRAPEESARRRFDILDHNTLGKLGWVGGVLFVVIWAVILYMLAHMVAGIASDAALRQRASPFEVEERAALIVYYSGRTQEAMRRLGKVIETCSAAIPSEKSGSEFHQRLSLVMFHAHARLAKMHRANGGWDLGETHAYKAHALSKDAGIYVAVPEMVFEYIEGKDKAAWLYAKEVAARRQS